MSSTVKSDNSWLSRIDRGFHKIETFFALIAGLVILALMLLAVWQIIGRKVFNAPVYGFVDWVEQFMAVSAMLGVAYCHRLGGHIRMDILVTRLHGRLLWFFEIVSTLVMMVIVAALTVGSYWYFLRSTQGDLWKNLNTLFTEGFSAFFLVSSRDSSIDINLPLWPAKLLVPIAFLLLFIRLILHLWGYTRAFINNEEEPVAVPLPEDAATHAKHEAEILGEINNNNGASSS